jgi:hypothetical protein
MNDTGILVAGWSRSDGLRAKEQSQVFPFFSTDAWLQLPPVSQCILASPMINMKL